MAIGRSGRRSFSARHSRLRSVWTGRAAISAILAANDLDVRLRQAAAGLGGHGGGYLSGWRTDGKCDRLHMQWEALN
jgi:hypothetical protein